MATQTSISFERVLQLTLNSKIPFEAIKEIENWGTIIKSPYGHSYYNGPVGWDFKTPDSFRIADHWNFTSQGKKHCETTTPIDNCWAIGQYDANLKRYVILKVFPTPTEPLVKDKDFAITLIKYQRERALNRLKALGNENHVSQCDLNFLLRYFRTLEKFR